MLVGNRRSTVRAAAPSQRVTVSLYEKPPREEMTLEEFEVFAVDRLKVLRTIDALRQKGFKPKELEAELAPVVRELLPLASAGPQAPSDARKDSVSHFILRLAYSRSEELRRWFLTQECALFRHRLSRLRGDGFARFLREHGLKFEEVPDSERDARVTSLARIKNYENVPAQTATYYRVPFLEAIDLIGRREVYLEKGYAYVPQAKLHSIVVSRFRASLSRSLAKASGSLAAAAADPRLGPQRRPRIAPDFETKTTIHHLSWSRHAATPRVAHQTAAARETAAGARPWALRSSWAMLLLLISEMRASACSGSTPIPVEMLFKTRRACRRARTLPERSQW